MYECTHAHPTPRRCFERRTRFRLAPTKVLYAHTRPAMRVSVGPALAPAGQPTQTYGMCRLRLSGLPSLCVLTIACTGVLSHQVGSTD